jgi:hypothetical protein
MSDAVTREWRFYLDDMVAFAKKSNEAYSCTSKHREQMQQRSSC